MNLAPRRRVNGLGAVLTGTMATMFRRTLLGALTAFAFSASVAHAGTISASGTTITYQAAPGEANFLSVNWGNVGAGADYIPTLDDHADITAVLYGEDGDDDLESDASSDVLDGGPGNDTLSPDDDDSGPGDVVAGGPGIDTLQTGNPTGTAGPIAVSFDGVPNDGYPGEGDTTPPISRTSRRPARRPRSTSWATTGRTPCNCGASRPTRSPGSVAMI